MKRGRGKFIDVQRARLEGRGGGGGVSQIEIDRQTDGRRDISKRKRGREGGGGEQLRVR